MFTPKLSQTDFNVFSSVFFSSPPVRRDEAPGCRCSVAEPEVTDQAGALDDEEQFSQQVRSLSREVVLIHETREEVAGQLH